MGTNGTFATSGQIVLTHEIDNTTMQLAVDNLAKIQKAYKNVIDVATCYNISYPYFEDYQFTDVMDATSTTDSTANSTDSDSASSTTISLKLAKAAASVNAGSATIPSFGLAIVLIAALVF